MNINEMRVSLAQSLRDPGMEQVNPRLLLVFINDAAFDAGNEDWLFPIGETTGLANTEDLDYAIPDEWASIHMVRVGEEHRTRLEDYKWHLYMVPSDYEDVPVIRFDPRFTTAEEIDDFKIIGQRRPKRRYREADDVIDTGLESFIRERATYYGARFIARRGGDQATFYTELAKEAFATSTEKLLHQRARMSQQLYGRLVPGR